MKGREKGRRILRAGGDCACFLDGLRSVYLFGFDVDSREAMHGRRCISNGFAISWRNCHCTICGSSPHNLE